MENQVINYQENLIIMLMAFSIQIQVRTVHHRQIMLVAALI
ncbi:hypothetical protein [Neobacillus sp. OS1-33]|nr:hypothetical protein [Neobacillus sp. OS1-33]WML26828.1 hypothetical protein RCG22_04095 [Neobacillus sp. OS1-33]